MNTLPLKCGSNIWIPQPKELWRPAHILSVSPDGIYARLRWLDAETEETFEINLLTTGNESIFECAYKSILHADLSCLDIINEAEVLHNLKTRFSEQQDIYTYCGLLLIILNPYKELPIYGAEFMSAYNQNSIDIETRRDPHIFAIADESLSRMKLLHQNQSIIISGESGAGKTMSAKHVLMYLTAMTSPKYCVEIASNKAVDSMPTRVLASSPLLESLGNAKTARNDNSSRFGKFIEIGFCHSGNRLTRAEIKTFLLEKSRVVLQIDQERNYHVFYQIMAAVNDHNCKQFYTFIRDLSLGDSISFHYAKLKDVESNDLKGFETTVKAMHDLGFGEREISDVFALLAVVLHLGNVTYTESAQDGSQITTEGVKSLAHVLRTLQCKNILELERDTQSRLCHRIICTVDGDVRKRLSVQEAVSARDSLAKLVYQLLFNWIVARCNEALDARSDHGMEENSIGILDIYGFEVMHLNGFEQFCINFANEKLQQRFIKNVFELEQEEYLREGLEWNFIEYCDNEPCIKLFEGPMGLIALLNDECKLPKPQDRNWLARICNEHLGRSRAFSQSKFWAQERFMVQHFAGTVEYTINEFVEKNLDRIIPEHANILTYSENSILQQMLKGYKGISIGVGIRQGIFTKPTVVTQFFDSLKSLMEILNGTTSHYVRCIKPNDQKAPFTFCAERVLQQLRACGVIQTIKINAAGYPSRCSYADFLDRYWQLRPNSTSWSDDPVKRSEIILRNIVKDASKYRLGKTKIFFGNGVLARIERTRNARIIQATTTIQKHVRGWLVRKHYQTVQQLIVSVQAHARRWLALKHYGELQRKKKQQVQNNSQTNHIQSDPNNDSGTIGRTLNRFFVHKSSKPTKTKPDIARLEQEIENLRNQLAVRDREILVMKSQIRQENTLKNTSEKRGKGDINGSHNEKTDHKYVIYSPRDEYQTNLLVNIPNTEHLKQSCISALTPEYSNTALHSPSEIANQLLDLQQKCALLDVEKHELYQRLEMYQESFAVAKARQTEAQRSIQRLEKLVEHQSRRVEHGAKSGVSEVQTDCNDMENLEKILEIQRESNRRMQKEIELLNCEKNQLQSKLSEQTTELQALKGSKVSTSSRGVVSKDDVGNRVSRLVAENTQLREQLSTTNALNRRLTFSTKYFAELVQRHDPEFLQLSTLPRFLEVQQLIAIAENRAHTARFHDSSAKSKLVRCLEGQEAVLVNCLVNCVGNTRMKSWSPLFVADFLFILLCGADAMHDEAQISTVLKVFIEAMQTILTTQSSTYELILFWVVSIFGLRNRINQYGGSSIEMECEEESPYVLKNYNIHPFVPIFNDLIILGLQIFVEQINEVILPPSLITGAVLEYEPIENLTCQALIMLNTRGLGPHSTWLRRKPHFDRLMNTLDDIYDFLVGVHADSILMWHVFYRVFYYICSSALNSILLRKDLCNWARGAQIRHNLASLETWLSDKDLIPEGEDSNFYRRGRCLKELQLPLVQVCLLLQSKKGGTEKVKISSVCHLCPNLTSTQILRLLSRCTLVSGFEEVVQPEFLEAVSRRLHEERPRKTFKTICCGLEVSQKTLLLDSDHWRSSVEELTFPRKSTPLSEFQIPSGLEDVTEFIIAVDM